MVKTILSIVKEECPNCHKSKVFASTPNPFKIPEMFDHCENCHYRFDREPGYFIGALYLSYGLAVLEGILTFLLFAWLSPNTVYEWRLLFILLVFLLMARKNYKWARIAYIHIFPW